MINGIGLPLSPGVAPKPVLGIVRTSVGSADRVHFSVARLDRVAGPSLGRLGDPRVPRVRRHARGQR
jgi:hypothetical protein